MNTNLFDHNDMHILPRFNALNEPTRQFVPLKTNVKAALAEKHLAILRDPATGALYSKDGRKNDPNLPLARLISENYTANESMYLCLRQIAATGQYSGLVSYADTGLSRYRLTENIRLLNRAGIIARYTEYAAGFYVELAPEAREFLNKGFSQIYLTDFVKKNLRPDELFFDVTLADDRNSSERYKADLIYRNGDRVKYVCIAMNPKLPNMANQIEKIVRFANRFDGSLSIVISPSADKTALYNTLRSRLGYGVRVPNIVPYTQPMLLR